MNLKAHLHELGVKRKAPAPFRFGRFNDFARLERFARAS
jgi:hypothetical protein